MTSTTFDGSTPTGAAGPLPVDPEPEVLADFGMSALDQLRERVAEAAATKEEWVHEIPKVGVRITCDTNIEAADYQRWVGSAMPKQPRGRGGAQRNFDPVKMRREALSARSILNSCTGVEMKGSDGVYRPVLSPSTQQPLLLDDPEFCRAFGVPDPIELMRRIFVRDSDLINAGEELLRKAGYMPGDEDEDDDPDPT